MILNKRGKITKRELKEWLWEQEDTCHIRLDNAQKEVRSDYLLKGKEFKELKQERKETLRKLMIQAECLELLREKLIPKKGSK